MERGKNFYLYTLDRIKEGKSPSQISKELSISKQRLNFYISSLKKAGSIQKLGYGTWEFIKDFEKRSKSKTAVIGKNSGGGLTPGSVRGHGFLFKLELPNNLKNWDKREEILNNLKIKFNYYYVGGIKRGQRLVSQNTKVALTDKNILINFPESYIRETSILAQKDAIAKFLRVVKNLERILRGNFSQFGKYKFRVLRQHYSLIKNSLARQYLNNEYNSKKLHVYSSRGLWLLIDNSYNLEELETIHKNTAVKDNIKVQDFFNGLDMIEGFTPQFVLKALAENNTQLLEYSKQNKEHLALIQDYRKESIENRKIIQALLKKMNNKNI